MLRKGVILLICLLSAFHMQAQKVTFKEGKVFSSGKPILNLVPIQNERTGISLRTLKGKEMLTIYEGNLERGEEKGYVVKFTDDNKYCVLFRKADDSRFFTGIIEDLVAAGVVVNDNIDTDGKKKFLAAHPSNGIVEPGDLINY